MVSLLSRSRRRKEASLLPCFTWCGPRHKGKKYNKISASTGIVMIGADQFGDDDKNLTATQSARRYTGALFLACLFLLFTLRDQGELVAVITEASKAPLPQVAPQVEPVPIKVEPVPIKQDASKSPAVLPKPQETPISQETPAPDKLFLEQCGCPQSCTKSELGFLKPKGMFICQDRIYYLQSNYNMERLNACRLAVAEGRWCRASCNPDNCATAPTV